MSLKLQSVKPDPESLPSFPAFGATVGQRIKLDNGLLQNARSSIWNLVNEFDQKVVANNVVAANELQP